MIVASIIRDLPCGRAEALSILLNPHRHYQRWGRGYCLLTHVEMNAYRWGVTSPESLKLVAEFELTPSSHLYHFRTLKII